MMSFITLYFSITKKMLNLRTISLCSNFAFKEMNENNHRYPTIFLTLYAITPLPSEKYVISPLQRCEITC